MSSAPRWSPSPDFARLFRPGAFRFEFALRPAVEPWFRLADFTAPELAERRALLTAHPERHAPWESGADVVLDALLGLFPEPEARVLKGGGAGSGRILGGRWEPDFVLLRRDDEGEFRMAGGCVCDPSAWDPAGKLGRTVMEIHSPVPPLNAELGTRIRAFLNRLPPDATLSRENWGLAAVPDRNLLPSLSPPRLARGASVSGVWLRVEHQAFRALPAADGILFVIWLTVHPLAEALTDPVVRASFRHLLESMPASIADYKGLAEARPALIEQLVG